MDRSFLKLLRPVITENTATRLIDITATISLGARLIWWWSGSKRKARTISDDVGPVLTVRRPGFIPPCQPSRVARPPSGPSWVREIKHDGYRLMVRRDGERVRSFTKNGHDWANRFPAIVDAALPDF
jgi:ATP-dependent DNA ligase